MAEDKPRKIPFHENRKRYIWDKASGTVYDSNNEPIAWNCHNMKVARDKVCRL
jgi:hypothetical protein